MGRKAGPIKHTKVFRITPDDDVKLEEILKYWQASRGWHNMKVYTRSDVVGQALRQYWLQQKQSMKPMANTAVYVAILHVGNSNN